ncbi:MAG: hypothetical protein ABIN83_06010 [Sphingomicrobium sp.]
MPVSFRSAAFAAALLFATAIPAMAQDSAVSPPAGDGRPDKAVEGATPERVALIDACKGHKFETMVEVDAATHRASRVKLCAKPGASDADWVKTLQSAIAQIEQRNMPPKAQETLIAQMRAEIGKYAKSGAADAPSITGNGPLNVGRSLLAESNVEPEAPFETSALPPLTTRALKSGAPTAKAVTATPIRATLRCSERGQTGRGGPCDVLEQQTILAITAIAALDPGTVIRFLRRGTEFRTVAIGALSAGQTRRIPMVADICKGLLRSEVSIEVRARGSNLPGATFGPYALRC